VPGSGLAVLRSDDIAHPVCGIGCAALRQSGGDDRKAFPVERADRRDQSEDQTRRGELRSIGELAPHLQNHPARDAEGLGFEARAQLLL
jgi:hypothetical protein